MFTGTMTSRIPVFFQLERMMRDFSETGAPLDEQSAMLGIMGAHSHSIQQMASEFAQKVKRNTCNIKRNVGFFFVLVTATGAEVADRSYTGRAAAALPRARRDVTAQADRAEAGSGAAVGGEADDGEGGTRVAPAASGAG